MWYGYVVTSASTQKNEKGYTCIDIVDYVDIVENVETVDDFQQYQQCINTKINPLSIENKGFQQNQQNQHYFLLPAFVGVLFLRTTSTHWDFLSG